MAESLRNIDTNINTSTNKQKNIDDIIKQRTDTNYLSLYGKYRNIVNGIGTRNSLNEQLLQGDSETNKASNIIEYASWDPRLARIDGFVSQSGTSGLSTKDHPLIVPFASATAAGAFYDMVFTIERGVDKIVMLQGGYDSVPVESTKSQLQSVEYVSTGNDTAPDVNSTEKIWRATDKEDRKVKSTITNDGNSYGIASIVNPYTLTKLCGGLVKLNTTNTGKDDINVENHMYDVRDSRRFYGNVIKSGTDDVLSVTNPTTTNIITYSNSDIWGRTPYYFLDFVFCKHWKIIPNNRLITLRKYHAPVYDNLLFSNMFDNILDSEAGVLPFAPIATVVTYFGEDTGNSLSLLLSFSTGTNWQDIESDVHNVSGDTGSDPHAVIDNMFDNGGGFPAGDSNVFKSMIGGANFLTGKMFSFGKFVGLLSPDGYNINKDQKYFDKMSEANKDPMEQLYANKIMGPVNRVTTTKARKAGITFDLKISVTCSYVARPIGGVNTKAAILDILSNCMEISSVDAMFWGGGYHFGIQPLLYPFRNTAFKNRIMDDLYAGRIFGKNGALAHTVEGIKKLGTTDKNGNDTGSFDWSNITGKLGEVLGETLGALGEMLNSISNTIFGSSTSLGEWLNGAADQASDGSAERGKKKLNSLAHNLLLMWRSQVVQNSVMPRLDGMKAILTGEPVGNWHLTVGNPLNPIMVVGNLICSDMKIEWGDELGPDDFPLELKITYTLEHGMPRDKSGILSMFNRGMGRIYQLPDWIRASSDYETKVDNYTGPTGDNSFFTPKYMHVNQLMAMGGTGFLTYKLSKPVLLVSAHTDNTVIAKFTPPDVDAAISNILQGSLTFFGSNAGSRAWIRGIAATRKLMN